MALAMKVGLTNFSGRMGKALLQVMSKESDIKISAGLSRKNDHAKYPFLITNSIIELINSCDIIIDFSVPLVTTSLLNDVQSIPKPLVICTTGLNEKEFSLMKARSKTAPIFYSPNTSIGINVLYYVLPILINSLGKDFDIDVIDKHHKHKKDAPSGTAKFILDIIAKNLNLNSKEDIIYNNTFKATERPKNKIGFSFIRAGNIFGEHEISMTSDDEMIKISHIAFSRDVFAKGAIKAAKWLKNQPPGLYQMSDLLNFGHD
jgi:4-hydroxy-tetrahydrodipicolinate reductase